IGDGFEISGQAVKKESKIFKSILKLDKNFHVYIHGKREYIEKGFDEERGKHFYKLYFDQES
ncbi:MAG: nucleoid-associated protein, partial [Olivibacter sp.]|nr:nucleoid-associated protein [Olivibacter sp. UJ_SKK_5.1]